MLLQKFLRKIIKGFAYASASGGVAIGAASVDLVQADFLTIVYVVVAGTLFNTVKEALKSWGKKILPPAEQ